MAAARILETGTDCHRFVWNLDAGLLDKDNKTTLSFLRHLSLLHKIKISRLRGFCAERFAR